MLDVTLDEFYSCSLHQKKIISKSVAFPKKYRIPQVLFLLRFTKQVATPLINALYNKSRQIFLIVIQTKQRSKTGRFSN